MRTTSHNHTIFRVLFWALLSALAGVSLAASAETTESTARPANGTTSETELRDRAPDGGGCWTEISTQNVLTGGNYLLAMDGDPDTGAILAAGYYTAESALQTQLVEFYTGSSFQIVPNPTGLGPYSRLQGVGAIPGTNNEFWLVGSTSYISGSLSVIERFNGTSLSTVPHPQPSGVAPSLNDVDASSPTFAIAVGRVQSFGEALTPVILRWNGTSWVAETAPSLGNYELSGVTTFSDGRAVAVGIDYDPDVRQLILTRNAGGTWSQPTYVLPGSNSRLTSVDATNPTEIVAVGYKFTADGFRPYAVHGNMVANTWDNVDLPAPENGDTTAVNVSCAPATLIRCAVLGDNDYQQDITVKVWFRINETWNSAPDPPASSVRDIAPAGYVDSVRQDLKAGRISLTEARAMIINYRDPCGGQPTPTPGGATATPMPTNTRMPTQTPGGPTATPKPCTIQFNDVQPGSTFYPFVRCLACKGIITGYACGGPGEPCPGSYFRSNALLTRGQLTKIVSESAGIHDPVSGQTFEDVPPDNTFWVWIERLAATGSIGGYSCGGPGEPCVPPGNRPYFRWSNNITRGQISKITAVTAGWNGPIPTTQQTFTDVPSNSPFWVWIEELTGRGIISGYPCGGLGEPCDPQNRPYFRWGNNVTRGQAAKIEANSFFPNCSP